MSVNVYGSEIDVAMGRILATLPKCDWLLIGATYILVAFGLAAIYSVALSVEGGDLFFFEKQLIAIAIGTLLFVLLSLSHFRLFRNWTLLVYLTGIFLLIGVLIFGATVRGTTGWFTLFGFSFQPVEFMKIALVLCLAKYFSEKARRQFGSREIFVSGALTFLPTALVMAQPDFGSASVLIGLWIVFIFFAGIRFLQAVLLALIAAVSAVIAWLFFFADYQRERILIFIDPERDPLGRGYNVLQAIIAIGSGQWFGRGLGFGSQSQLKFLPESQTDFIFAVLAEELGFVGVLMVFGAFILLFSRLFKWIKSSRDDYTSYLLIGLGAVLFIQVLVNIGMNLGLTPVTGIALPLVSYGGSSLLMSLTIIGLVHSIALRARSQA